MQSTLPDSPLTGVTIPFTLVHIYFNGCELSPHNGIIFVPQELPAYKGCGDLHQEAQSTFSGCVGLATNIGITDHFRR